MIFIVLSNTTGGADNFNHVNDVDPAERSIRHTEHKIYSRPPRKFAAGGYFEIKKMKSDANCPAYMAGSTTFYKILCRKAKALRHNIPLADV